MPNPRFPTPPNKNDNINDLMYPPDQKQFYATFNFYNYKALGGQAGPLVGSSLVGIVQGFIDIISQTFKMKNDMIQTSKGTVILPLPKKINDATTLTWNEESLTSKAMSIAGEAAAAVAKGADVVSPLTGLAVNPFLFMQFQRPNFKEFVFQWTFTPTSIQESQSIKSIIKKFQKSALPTFDGVLLEYPDVVNIKFYPNDLFGMMTMKTCAIISVQVDYTGAGAPSFFKQQPGNDGGAATVINLSVSLKEIQLWSSEDIN